MHRLAIILEIILIFILPILWFLLGLGLWEHRLVIFEIFVGLLILLAISHKMNFREMGFRLDNFFQSARLLFPGVLLAIIIIVLFYEFRIGTKYFFNNWWNNYFFAYYFLLSALSQEFGYRGYLVTRLKSLFKNPLPIILINASLFALLHILHLSLFITIEAFFFGAFLTWVYLKKPNLIASSLAHALVGGLVIILGFM